MNDSEQHDTRENLHQELELTDNLDDESHQHLQHYIGDISISLDHERPSPSEHYQSFDDQLNEGIQRDEMFHPSLPASMSHAKIFLSKVGVEP
jgi:hypothetical protein